MKHLLAICTFVLTACAGNGGSTGLTDAELTGLEHSYRVVLSTDATMPKGQDGTQKAFGYDLHADLRVTTLSNDAQGRHVLLTVDSPKLVSDLPQAQQTFDAASAELAHAQAVLTLKEGRLVETRLSRDVSALAGGILLTLAGNLQHPDGAVAQLRDQEEADGTGKYVARYARDAATQRLTKKKLRYTQVLPSSTVARFGELGAYTPKVLSSAGTVDLDGSLVRGVNLDETISASTLGAATFTTRTKVSLSLVGTKRAPERDNAQLLAGTSIYEVGKPFFKVENRAGIDDARIAGRTFEQLIEGLTATESDAEAREFRKGGAPEALPADKAEARQKWVGKSTELFGALVSIHRQQPETVQKSIDGVRNGSPITDALVQALAAAGTTESQAALVSFIRDASLPSRVRMHTMLALMRLKAPNAETAKAIETAIDDPVVGIHAAYAIGTYARLLRESGDHALSAHLSDTLMTRARAEQRNPMLVHLLRALANSADPRAIDIVLPHLASNDEEVRAAAVQSLHIMDDPRVEALIIAQMTEAVASTDVRLAALDAASMRAPTRALVDAASARARDDQSRSVRTRAIRLLERWMPAMPEATTTLREIASTANDSQTKDAARQALENGNAT